MKLLVVATKVDNRLFHRLMRKSCTGRFEDLPEETTEASDEEFEKYGLNEDEAIIMVFDNNDKFLRCIGVKKLKEFLRNEPPN